MPRDGFYSFSGLIAPLSTHKQPVTMLECSSLVISMKYINMTSPNSSSSALVFGKHLVYSCAYIIAGSLFISKLEDDCRISKVAWASLQSPSGKVLNNFSEIHSAMAYGLELSCIYFPA